MLIHISMPAENPAHVADVIAELLGGYSFPFPPFPGSFTAMAGDEHGTSIEVYPRGSELVPADDDADAQVRHNPKAGLASACHAALRTSLNESAVHALASREGWICRTRSRGGIFRVIELWVENAFLLEMLTDEMAAEYSERVTIEGWRAMLAAGPPGT